MPKIEPFERYANKYEDWFERNKFAYESELRAIRKLMPKNGEGVEIGVGSGRFAAPLGIKVGVEPSCKMREIAQKKGIKVIDGVAEELPFSDLQFDFVLMVTNLCFLDDIEAALKEIHRVLKSGGSFILGFIDANSPIGRLYQQQKNENVFYREATFYSVEEVVAYLKKAGFKDFNFKQTLFRTLTDIRDIEPVKEGYGEGSFVVVKATK
ncbi:MAG TPA: class I SAM-dependent methyltransferase [Terriglobales bacterium]|nr:class I SAM-dependent methyltransferase [Terriglobales bacterium]